jgi:hypothetical protein
MSVDEKIVAAVAAGITLFAWLGWYVPALTVGHPRSPGRGRPVLLAAPIVSAALLYLVLQTASAYDVRDDWRYVVFYLVLGAAWVGVAAKLLPLAGVSVRDDVLERGNPAAAYAAGGALLAISLCFAGGNIGDGPGWWVVVFSAALATAALFALWLGLDTLAGLADTVTIDRDRAAGVRLAGFLVASGIILGRAVAGDWVSTGATVRDFVLVGWPVLPLLGVAAALERNLRPTPERAALPAATHGVLPALLFVGAAVAYVLLLGAPAGAPE